MGKETIHTLARLTASACCILFLPEACPGVPGGGTVTVYKYGIAPTLPTYSTYLTPQPPTIARKLPILTSILNLDFLLDRQITNRWSLSGILETTAATLQSAISKASPVAILRPELLLLDRTKHSPGDTTHRLWRKKEQKKKRQQLLKRNPAVGQSLVIDLHRDTHCPTSILATTSSVDTIVLYVNGLAAPTQNYNRHHDLSCFSLGSQLRQSIQSSQVIDWASGSGLRAHPNSKGHQKATKVLTF